MAIVPQFGPMNLEEAQALLSGLVALNRVQLRRGVPSVAAAILSGSSHNGPHRRRVRYIRRDPGEYWRSLKELWRFGGGDCEDLAAAIAAELQERGIPAEARILAPKRGRTAHAIVVVHGRVIDPSAIAGMGESWDIGAVGAVGASGRVPVDYSELFRDLSLHELLTLLRGLLGAVGAEGEDAWTEAAGLVMEGVRFAASPLVSGADLMLYSGALADMAREQVVKGADTAGSVLVVLSERFAQAARTASSGAGDAVDNIIGLKPGDLAKGLALGLAAVLGVGAAVLLSSGGQLAVASVGQGIGSAYGSAGRGLETAIPGLVP